MRKVLLRCCRAACLTALLAPGYGPAQELSPPPVRIGEQVQAGPAFIPGRPVVTEGTDVVTRGYVQVEVGFTNAGQDQFSSVGGPETAIRVGLSNRMEIRAGWEGWQWDDAANESGFADAQIALKANLWPERPGRIGCALLASAVVPVGQRGFSSERWDPAALLAFGLPVNDRWSIGWSGGVAGHTDVLHLPSFTAPDPTRKNTDLYATYSAEVSVLLTLRSGLSLEMFGESPVRDGNSAPYVDSSLIIFLTRRLSVDFIAGAGLSRKADDWFIGSGFAVRLPQ